MHECLHELRERFDADPGELVERELALLTLLTLGDIMADLNALNDAITNLQSSESAAATELKTLADEVARLTAGTITQAQIDGLTSRVTDVASALTSATTAAQPPAPAPVPAPTPAPAPSLARNAAGFPLYTFDGDPSTPPAGWTRSVLTTADGKPLFTFDSDAANGSATGDAAPWHAYAGATVDPTTGTTGP